MADGKEGNGWPEYSRLVISQIDKHTKEIEILRESLFSTKYDLQASIVSLAEQSKEIAKNINNISSILGPMQKTIHNMSYLQAQIEQCVTRSEFTPIRSIVYGGVGFVLISVLGGLISILIK